MANDNRDKKLTQRQELAVRELGKGKGLAAAARAAGVSRQTIYRWLSDPGFVAAMNRWRESVVTMAQGQILAGLGDAAATVVKAAREGNARIALTLLEKTGVFDPIARNQTDEQKIARDQALHDRGQRAALDKAEQDLVDAELLNNLRRVHHELRPSAPPTRALPTPAPQPPNPPPSSDEPPPSPPNPPPPPTQSALAPDPSPGPATYIPDPELEAAIAAADALKSAEAAILEARRKAEEQQSPPPVSDDLSHPSHPSHPPRRPRRAADARATVQAKVDYYDPYAPGMPEPIDKLEDQFTDIAREDRRT